MFFANVPIDKTMKYHTHDSNDKIIGFIAFIVWKTLIKVKIDFQLLSKSNQMHTYNKPLLIFIIIFE